MLGAIRHFDERGYGAAPPPRLSFTGFPQVTLTMPGQEPAWLQMILQGRTFCIGRLAELDTGLLEVSGSAVGAL